MQGAFPDFWKTVMYGSVESWGDGVSGIIAELHIPFQFVYFFC
jgi:hypothetical protein